MNTPYDGKILLVVWKGIKTPGGSPGEFAELIQTKMPNVGGVIVKTSNGVSWQGHLGNDDDPKAITGVRRIEEWAEAFQDHDLDLHIWSVPRARQKSDLPKEADKIIRAAKIPGVKSLLLDIEHGEFYWQGDSDDVREFMQMLRADLPETHIGLNIDGRQNRPFDFYVDPWIPFIDSIHPQIYPILFGSFRTITGHIDESERLFNVYGKPIIPMLQSFGGINGRPTSEEITQQGQIAFDKGYKGITYFRVGKDKWGVDGLPHTGDPEYTAIARIELPVFMQQPEEITYTWQQVINAVVTVACRRRQEWTKWMDDINFWAEFHNTLRKQSYSGKAIEEWPLDSHIRLDILALLELDAGELATLTVLAQGEYEDWKNRQKEGKESIIGMHGAPGVGAPSPENWDTWIDHLHEMGVKWYKQCDFGDPNDSGPASVFAWAKRLQEEGIEPIIRYLHSEQFPQSLPDSYFQKMKQYADAGILWAEIGNEPNLNVEWHSAWKQRVNHNDDKIIKIIAETWITDAQKALDAGVKPAFYAFAPTDWHGAYNPRYSSVFFQRKVVAYLAQHFRAETVEIFEKGGWIAVHCATYEQPANFDPYRPDGTVWDMTLRSYEVVLDAFRDSFGNGLNVDELVVMSTEGGVFTPESNSMFGHIRLQTNEEHARKAVEMFEWLMENSPLQAMCPWCISCGNLIGHCDDNFRKDGWIEEIDGGLRPRTVYEALRQLRFDMTELLDETAIKLDVPYISQWDETAGGHTADCGPTCLAMILNASPNSHNVTVDTLYEQYLPDKPTSKYTSIAEMINILKAEIGPDVQGLLFNQNGTEPLDKLRNFIEQGIPVTILVNYEHWDDIAENNFSGGHFVVVTGFDDKHVTVHDPLFRAPRREKGRYFIWRNEKFLKGWGQPKPETGNPAFWGLTHKKVVAKV